MALWLISGCYMLRVDQHSDAHTPQLVARVKRAGFQNSRRRRGSTLTKIPRLAAGGFIYISLPIRSLSAGGRDRLLNGFEISFGNYAMLILSLCLFYLFQQHFEIGSTRFQKFPARLIHFFNDGICCHLMSLPGTLAITPSASR